MLHRIRPLFAALVIASGAFLASAPAAHATTNGITDAAGNAINLDGGAASSHGDIVFTGIDYTDGNVIFGLKVASPVDPTIDSNWVNSQASAPTGAEWRVGTPAATYDVFYSDYQGQPHAWATPDGNPSDVLCLGHASYQSEIYDAQIPADCLGHPASVSIDMAFIGYNDVVGGTGRTGDLAPKSGSCCLVTETTTQSTTTTQPQPDPSVQAAAHGGYWMVTQDGHVYPFGVPTYGDAPTGSATHIEPNPAGTGYWVLDANGTVYAFGQAQNLGSATLNSGEKAVSLSATPTGNGYWVFTDKGRVIPFGTAPSFGDMSGTPLNGSILGSVATPTGHGYWMVGSDGGIFSFGDATFHGSTGNLHLNKPVMAMAPAPDGSGYWLVASDGGIFAFDVPFYGSMGATHLNKPITGMVPGSGGYMMVGQDGGIFSFGNVAFHGSLGANPPASPVAGVALQP